jgi:ribosomal protein L34
LTGPTADARLPAPHCGQDALSIENGLSGAPTGVLMKLKVRRSKSKRLKLVGFRTRSKTAGGRKVIKRKIKRSGKFRVG